MNRELAVYRVPTFRKSMYASIRMAQEIRWKIKREYKPVFDAEADPDIWDYPVEGKAKRANVTPEFYEMVLGEFSRWPTVKLAILLFRVENDFISHWWESIKKCEGLAISQMETNPLVASKLLLQIEREKQMGIKRLIQTGRMINPDQYIRTKVRLKKHKSRSIISDDGVVQIEG